MHAAQFFEPLPGKPKTVRCTLCPKYCVVPDGGTGFCSVRKNECGALKTLIYSRLSSIHVDPIEKKPLFHFLPGAPTLSVGTVGCNLGCLHCQNHTLARAKPGEVPDYEVFPETLVELAKQKGCPVIAHTYNEPTINIEYLIDCAKLARKEGIKSMIVSNGYINPEPLKALLPHIDAANIDLKSMDASFYQEVCAAERDPVLETISTIAGSDCWLEVTNLMIPGRNDSPEQMSRLIGWIEENVGTEVPLHLSRFFPHHRMQDTEPTPKDSMLAAFEEAKKRLSYVYLGNIAVRGASNTYCPKCSSLLVSRSGFGVMENNLSKDACPDCGATIAGAWE